MVPYLKGFHLTIEIWQGGRDAKGWKLKTGDDPSGSPGAEVDGVISYTPLGEGDKDEATAVHCLASKTGGAHAYAPMDSITTPVPRFKDDIEALLQLTDFKLPPLRVVRPVNVVHVYYGFRDASGKQFGATLFKSYSCHLQLRKDRRNDQGVRLRVGLWTASKEEESSNYKELWNFVDTVSEEARAGRLRDCEFFLFTGNSTAKSCFYWGNSKSCNQHTLVLKLRTLEMTYGMTIHVVHISGKRMITQGTNGCLHGSLMEGVMARADMLSFVNLGLGGIDHHPPLLEWVHSWSGCPSLEALTQEGWFEKGHEITGGTLDKQNVWIPLHCKRDQMFLWALPPAVADAAMEELLKSQHKRVDLFHVAVIPRLMAPQWRHLFSKVCDFTSVVSPGPLFWPANMYKPLWVGVVLPFVRCRP
jgi:hypothetical protein